MLQGKRILLTGGAGFIGSNLADSIIKNHAASLLIIDNLSTGSRSNIQHLESNAQFKFIQADLSDYDSIEAYFQGIDVVLHLAALGSVPRSVENPIPTNRSNIDGFVNVAVAAKTHGVGRVVFASSSSVYGDDPHLIKNENCTGFPLSPYAVTKVNNEMYAKVFANVYSMSWIGLRFFNVFGPRQNPHGPYAAVIPLFIDALLRNENVKIFGSGEQSRDFTYVANIVHACLLASCTSIDSNYEIFNVGCGGATTVTELFEIIKDLTKSTSSAEYLPARTGDVYASSANIDKISRALNYSPEFSIKEGLLKTIEYYQNR